MSDAEFLERYGPVAMVTGASSGIGWAFAEDLAVRGLDLVLVARRTERLEALATRLRAAHGVAVTVLPLDLARRDAADDTLSATAGMDVGLVVSNAGYGFKGAHETVDANGLTDMLMVNCNMPLRLARGFVPRLKARGKGGIVMVSSVEGLIGCPGSAAYSASKALVVAFGEALWAELKPYGIEALTLCPGATESEAAANQGIDLATLHHVMPAAEVARVTLDAMNAGPTFFSSAHYKASFDQLLSMPRRDALLAMASAMVPADQAAGGR